MIVYNYVKLLSHEEPKAKYYIKTNVPQTIKKVFLKPGWKNSNLSHVSGSADIKIKVNKANKQLNSVKCKEALVQK